MIRNAYNSLNLLNRFVVNTLAAIALWYVFFYIMRRLPWVHPWYEALTENLTHWLLQASQITLGWMGEDSLIYRKSLQQIGGNGILLDRGCLGRNLMGLFAGFLLVFPGNWRSKLWFIPMGLAGIVLINISRIVGLYLTNKYWPQYMDINHHTVFKYTVYAFTFLLWYIWIKYFRLRGSKPKQSVD